MQDVTDAERDEGAGTSGIRRRTWTHLPALRIGARVQWRTRKASPAAAKSGEEVPADAAAAPQEQSREITSPRLLRVWRGVAGLALLAAGWALVVLTAEVFETVWRPLPRRGVLSELGYRLLGVLGMGFLALVACCCILAAAFALTLAITRRHW